MINALPMVLPRGGGIKEVLIGAGICAAVALGVWIFNKIENRK